MAKGTDQKALYIDQPQREKGHQYDNHSEECPHPPVAESSQQRESERGEIRYRAESREWNSRDLGVGACQDRLAALNDAARDGLRRVMMDRKIDRIAKPDERYERRS